MPQLLHYLSITELASLLRTRELSPVEVTRAQLERIAALDGAMGAYSLVTPEAALSAARQAEAEIVRGHSRGPLHGVPLAVKDLFWTQGIPTAAGMSIYRDYIPAEDATIVTRLKQSGAVLLGKLTMTEGAYSDYHPSARPAVNPWNAEYWTGISSSGPAVATAAGLCYGSIASDTGGSIRWPCAAQGLTGIKPTWGRVSRFGVFELAPTLDHVGPIARSASGAALLLQVIAGADEKDPTALTHPVPDYFQTPESNLHGLQIGVDPVWNGTQVDESVKTILAETAEVLRSLGAQIVEVSVPDMTQAAADWLPLCAVEAAVAHESTFPSRRHEYGPVLASVLDAGMALSGRELQRIRLRRMDLRARFARLMRTIDLLLTPVHPFAPLTLEAIQTLGERPQMILDLQRYTAPFDLTGSPTITLPGGFASVGLSIGFQLIARHLAEQTLVRAGVAFQAVTGWHNRHPPE